LVYFAWNRPSNVVHTRKKLSKFYFFYLIMSPLFWHTKFHKPSCKMMRVVFYMKVSGLKYRGLHRFFCRICSVAVFFVEFTFWQIFHKVFGIKFRIYWWMFVHFTSVGKKVLTTTVFTTRSLHPKEVLLTISHCVMIW
jgi:hypothetical protein